MPAWRKKSCIYKALSYSVSECQSNESAEFAIFHKIGCHGNFPWDIGKRGPDLSSALKTLLFVIKIAVIGPVDPEIIVIREIIKKHKKEKKKLENVFQSLVYSPLGAP